MTLPTYYLRLAGITEFGSTVAEAEAFCSSQLGQTLCSYDELCPSGAGTNMNAFFLPVAPENYIPVGCCGSYTEDSCDDCSTGNWVKGTATLFPPSSACQTIQHEASCLAETDHQTAPQKFQYMACCPPNGVSSCGGDPHFTTWSGQHFNYHGGCDLILAHAKSFHDGKGLNVHVRTKVESVYSIITAVGIRVGNSTFEFNHESVGDLQYFANNKKLDHGLPHNDGDFKITSRTVHNEDLNANVHIITVDLGQKSKITIDVMDQWVFVNIDASGRDVVDSVGLSGSYTTGKWLARDGLTDLTGDRNSFGNDWQVQPDDPQLFHSTPEGHPVAPYATCKLPVEDGQQHLRGKNPEMYKMAEKVCEKEGVSMEDMADCVFDVAILQNPKIAAAWWGEEIEDTEQVGHTTKSG